MLLPVRAEFNHIEQLEYLSASLHLHLNIVVIVSPFEEVAEVLSRVYQCELIRG